MNKKNITKATSKKLQSEKAQNKAVKNNSSLKRAGNPNRRPD
jgi:hypothetical protein